jgi:hypothetical protein
MSMLIKILAVVTAITVIATGAFAHNARHSIYDQAVAKQTVIATNTSVKSAKDIRGASPYVAIKNEPAPKLIVDPPLPEGLVQGVYWAQYRVENLHIVPVFGTSALQVSPRAGHLHVIVDDLPWWWADASDSNTVDIANLPPGQHKVRIELVDANHNVFPGQVVTQTFTIPDHNSAGAHQRNLHAQLTSPE